MQVLPAPATDGSDRSTGDRDSGGTARRDGSGGTERDPRSTDHDSGREPDHSGTSAHGSGKDTSHRAVWQPIGDRHFDCKDLNQR